MKKGTKTWFGGIGKIFTIKSAHQRQLDTLNDPNMEPIFRRFYQEGKTSLMTEYGMEFEEVLADLKNNL